MKIKDEYEKENHFLYKISSENSKCEVEVTKYSIDIFSKQYSYLKSYNVCGEENTGRRQMTTNGCYLKKDENDIDIVGDIITSRSPMGKLKDNDLFIRLYHTIGNFMPIPEGANKGGKSDHYERKLRIIKDSFEKEIDPLTIEIIEDRIKKGIALGNIRKNRLEILDTKPINGNGTLKYWIEKEWKTKGKTWVDYVIENYFQDFVDSSYNPIKFDSNIVNKLIIQRGYRIKYEIKSNEFNENEKQKLREIFLDFKLSKDIVNEN